ncbi:hypothetical protein C8046_05305 [Serinibacter arcticus]|uniref:DUF4430 domain-containing protein n=1 Tax=Serinibacter arcticus TaxID=1655435 RepID=A0A2U1ZT91_9MICO|nr:hypothetical protein [Serinibacter arcticus]PWD50170.1 hypothetical protein C8046_05305 [Serinibacter arcticus]
MRRLLTLTAAVAVTAVLASCSSGGSQEPAPSTSSSASESASPSESASESASPSATDSASPSASAAPGVTGGRDADDDVAEECTGVGITVDVGNLDDDRDDAIEDVLESAEGAWCIATDTTLTAREALDLAGITTEGTTEYGDAVICRVNGVPAADLPIPDGNGGTATESCAAMPAANAYWSMWIATTGGQWGYAEEGVDTQPLNVGDKMELLFTLNGEPVNPDTDTAG